MMGNLPIQSPHDVMAEKLITNFVCTDETKDIVIAMDGSASLGSYQFNKGKTALKKIIELGKHGGNHTKYAAVTFSNSAVVNFPFLPYTEAADIILEIPYPEGGNNTPAGLKEAKKLFDDPSSGGRIDATKVVFLVTDVFSSFKQSFTEGADKLKNSGVKIFVVASNAFQINRIDDLVNVASSPPEQFLFRVESLEGFLHVAQLVVEKVNSSLYSIPPHNVTATKLITNFLRIDPVNKQYPRHDTKDIVVLMEGPSSVGSNEFIKGKQALKNMIELEREGGNDTKYAAVTLSDSAVVNFAFLPYAEAADEMMKVAEPSCSTNSHAELAEWGHPVVLGSMSGIAGGFIIHTERKESKRLYDLTTGAAKWTHRDSAGGSNIHAGLEEAKKLFNDPLSGGRFRATKMVFLVIDGQTNLEKHLTELNVLKTSGMQIFAVAVGSSMDGIDNIADAISSPPEKFLFRVESLEGFLHVVELAVQQVYSSFYYDVPHNSVTAEKLRTNFLRNDKQSLTNDAKDIVVVMDSSAAIGRHDFDKGKAALKYMIGSFTKGGSDAKFAAVTFSSSTRASSVSVNFSFLPCQLAENQILNLPFPAGRIKYTYVAGLAVAEASTTFVEPSSAYGPNILAALTEVKKLFDNHSSGELMGRETTLRKRSSESYYDTSYSAGASNVHAGLMTGLRTLLKGIAELATGYPAVESDSMQDDPTTGCRIDATKMAFLLIDGRSNFEEMWTEADVLKNMGVKIFVVAVGSSIDGSSKIVNIASSPPEQFFFRVESLDGFLDVVKLANDYKQLYAAHYNVVPPPNVTARKLINNFLFSTGAVNPRVPKQNTKEDLPKYVVFVLDSSGSISSDEFDKGKKALENMMRLEREGGNDTKYAAVTFSTSAVVNFSFLPCTEAENGITNIPYQGGQTNTQDGLAKAEKLFNDLSTGRRVNATKNVFLVTDGQSNVKGHLTIPKADELKRSGVQIFVVAVGSYINGVDELVNVASSPPGQFLLRVASLDGFLQIVQLAVQEIYPGKYLVT